jgi:hypothetical protein
MRPVRYGRSIERFLLAAGFRRAGFRPLLGSTLETDRDPPDHFGDSSHTHFVRIHHFMMTLMRDIDYAAQAVRSALQQKFGRQHDLNELKVDALDKTIRVTLSDQDAEGTRDELLAAIRKAGVLEEFWSAN